AASMPECPLPVSFCPPSFFNRYGDPRHLPSFPTRRSSDLGRGIVYLHSEESEVSARRVFAVSHATHAVADRPGVHASAQVGADSDLVAYLWSGARDPWDVYVTRERMVAPKRLTKSLPASVDPSVL